MSKNVGNRSLTIVDVGCRWGFAEKFLVDDNVIIYGFDPDENECAKLREQYQNDKIQLIPLGLSDKAGKATLYLTKEPACSSLYKPKKNLTDNYPSLECMKEVGQTKVELTTLDKWAKKQGVDVVDYIKIDTQGSELNILKGAKKLLKTIRFIEIEVEFNQLYEGQPIFSEIDLFLRRFGFELWGFSNMVHYGMGSEPEKSLPNLSVYFDENRYETASHGEQVFWADAVYIKKDIILGTENKVDLEQLERDLILANRLSLHGLELRIQSHISEVQK